MRKEKVLPSFLEEQRRRKHCARDTSAIPTFFFLSLCSPSYLSLSSTLLEFRLAHRWTLCDQPVEVEARQTTTSSSRVRDHVRRWTALLLRFLLGMLSCLCPNWSASVRAHTHPSKRNQTSLLIDKHRHQSEENTHVASSRVIYSNLQPGSTIECQFEKESE